MCGFYGRIISPGASAAPFERGSAWIARRGPDSRHVWRSSNGAVELMHARLAIVDKTAAAHQPMSSADGQVTMVFNGEVYNHRALRSELAAYPFQNQSDTEILLALYEREGVQGLSRAKGMIVCAIVDCGRRRVILFRDAVGKKPLFLARWSGQILFGTNLLPLVAISGTSAKVAPGAAEAFWRQEFVGPGRSSLVDAEPVMPGEAVVLDFAGRELERTRIAPEMGRVETPSRPEEVEREFERLLSQAVRRRLEENPSPCLLLSGGLDSTAIAASMLQNRDALSEPAFAVTMGGVVPLINDEPYARYAAARLGMPLRCVRPASLFTRGPQLADQVAEAVSRQDEPLGMLSYFSRFQLLRAVQAESKIVLTGDGGDEVLLGYGQTDNWIGPPEPGQAPPDLSGPPTPPWMSAWGKSLNGVSLLGHNFQVLDRASAEQGVEARCPFMDWDLLVFLRSLPPQSLLAEGQSKGLLLKMLGDWPGWFLHRRKIGFALNLRWAWASRRFTGLREMVDLAAIQDFRATTPEALLAPPSQWRTSDIFQNFHAAWKLMIWSSFIRRLEAAHSSDVVALAEAS